MFCSNVYEFSLMTRVNLPCIFIISQYNKLKTKSKTSSQVNMTVFPVLEQKCKQCLNFWHSKKKGQKDHFSLFFQSVTLSILMIYFVSSLEMEIKYMFTLNNAQYNRLISRSYLCFYA
uniref:Uncharacterized protein n=1 Tax=Marmota marmota marmota TaxID=9994 RepID=A0A8C6ELV4_MARMA